MTKGSLPSVAIAGATGRIGKYITAAYLSPQFRSEYDKVVLLSRSESSPQLDEWKSQGATIRKYSPDNIASTLRDIDIVVNA